MALLEIDLCSSGYSMEIDKIAQFFEGKTIFITGATGFLAKIFVEKILGIQPSVKKLFLLMRPSNSKSCSQRLYQEIIDTELFKVLREKWGASLSFLISEKVVAVPGDISCENLGIQNSPLREQMWREIDVVINSAVTTRFDERYDVAVDINVFGALHILNFAKNCVNIKVLLHISTAFVCSEEEGLASEKPFDMRETLGGVSSYLDINIQKKFVDERLRELQNENARTEAIRSAMKDLGIQRARLHGWPNTYVFTKAMGEMVLEQFKEKLKVVIVRPTIVTSTFKDPFPGWIQGVRTVDSFLVAYGKGKLKFVLGDPKSILDLIPGDMVVNCILVAIVAHADQSYDHHIYHVGSSRRNPLKFSDVHEMFYSYFIKNPGINDRGKAVRVNKGKVLSSMDSFNKYIAIRHLPFLKILKLANTLSCHHFEATYIGAKRKVNLVTRLAEIYGRYVVSKVIFDDTNTQKLQVMAEEVDAEMFNFDPRSIQWKDYLMNIHIPGAIKHLF
ncbi:alcohol-forming fatty acyl-CoA reductase-like [Coffea arabica]|uniref:Fatty acyl-CoA reductase n=1 Tax=Coffea arabica TaxID=13443 RepID=A0ABM4W757_COFAR